jgi:hypothetical protein
MDDGSTFGWKIDECAGYFDRLRLRGWCFSAPEPIITVDLQFDGDERRFRLASYGQDSPDVAAALHPGATHARFDEWLTLSPELIGQPFALIFGREKSAPLIAANALTNCAIGDPYFQGWENFIAMLDSVPGGAVLEIGSRARSVITRGHRMPSRLKYVGMDVLPGPNVDVVGDAHELGSVFPETKFVAAFSTSVFEHLAMPWKVVIELNRILEVGAIVYTASHQTWPIHEEPWDFWRYSKHSWRALFNAATGFEILETAVGEPCRIHACRTSPVTAALPYSPGYLGVSCLARKVSETTLSWPVAINVAADSVYPTGELSKAPTNDRV